MEKQTNKERHNSQIIKNEDLNENVNPNKKELNKKNRENKEDIFDKLMKLPVLRLFYPLYEKKKEVLLYLFLQEG